MGTREKEAKCNMAFWRERNERLGKHGINTLNQKVFKTVAEYWAPTRTLMESQIEEMQDPITLQKQPADDY